MTEDAVIRVTQDATIRVVPASEAACADLTVVFGTRGDAARCQCQWFKVSHADWNSVSREERARRLREQTGCGDSGAETTSGLVAYLGDEPVGWCAVEPRTAYPRLAGMRIP